MTADLLAAFFLGFSAGSTCMWWYFHKVHLIRTREEWYAARQKDSR